MSYQFWTSKTVAARKPYRCDECSTPIAVGERHEYGAGKWDGDMVEQRLCLVCAAIISETFHAKFWDGDDGFPLTEVRSTLRDEYEIEDAEAWAKSHRTARLRKAWQAQVDAYNARFDPADEAGRELFEVAFKLGWLYRHDPSCEDEEDALAAYRHEVDGVVTGEAWDAYRDEFFARLPLEALGERPAAEPPQ